MICDLCVLRFWCRIAVIFSAFEFSNFLFSAFCFVDMFCVIIFDRLYFVCARVLCLNVFFVAILCFYVLWTGNCCIFKLVFLHCVLIFFSQLVISIDHLYIDVFRWSFYLSFIDSLFVNLFQCIWIDVFPINILCKYILLGKYKFF